MLRDLQVYLYHSPHEDCLIVDIMFPYEVLEEITAQVLNGEIPEGQSMHYRHKQTTTSLYGRY